MSNQPASIQICDRDCEKPAAFSYVWEWGEHGVCCPEHQAVLQQTAQNLGRTITFTALALAPAPLQRDERVRLIAEKLAAEAELEEVKKNHADLYNDGVKLTNQVQSLTTRKAALELQLKDLDRKNTELDARCQELEAVQADQIAELERLRRLVKYANPSEPPSSPAPTPPAAPAPAVVDG